MKLKFTLLFILTFTLSALWADYDCSYATALECGVHRQYSSLTTNHLSGSDYIMSNCGVGSNWSYSGADHSFYFDAGPTPKDITIHLTDLSADLDLLVFKTCDYGRMSSCVTKGINGGKVSEKVTINNATGRYYIVVDAYTSSVWSGFDIVVKCDSGYGAPSGCSAAKPLSCGSRKWVNAPTTNNMSRSDYDFSDCWESSYGHSFSGKDHLYKIEVGPHHKDLVIKLTGLHSDMDMFLFKSCGVSSHYGSTSKLNNCVAKSIKSGTQDEKIVVPNAVGTYYLAIDSDHAYRASGYEIEVDCETRQVASCDHARPLTCGARKWVNAPTQNHFSGSAYDMSACWSSNYSYSGADHVYKIDMGSHPKEMHIKMTGLHADMDMFLFRSCDSGSGHYGYSSHGGLRDCVAKSIKSHKSDESIHVSNASGVYYLVIDGYNHYSNSGYELSLDCHEYHSYGCSDAKPLSCGARKWVNAPTKNNLSGSDYDMSACWASGSDYTGKDHLYKINVGSNPQDLHIKMTGLHADMDMFLFRKCKNHYGKEVLTDCVERSARSGHNSESIHVANAQGTYYLAIDSRGGYASGYELAVDCQPKHYGFDCADAKPISCGSSKWVNAPTQNHMSGNDYNMSSCWSSSYDYTGKDHLYRLDLGHYETKDVKIKMIGLHGDMDLFVFKTCEDHYGNNRLEGCVAKSVNSGYKNEAVHLYNAKGTYYIAVDAYSKHINSGYEISVECIKKPTGVDCSDATPLACGTSKWVDKPTANNLSGSDYNTSGCWNSNYSYSGKDNLYKINVGSEKKKLIIDVTDLSGDMDLFLFKNCGSYHGHGKLTNCVAKSTRSGSKNEQIVLDDAQGTYYLAVDAYNAHNTSGYEIAVKCEEYTPEPTNLCAGAAVLHCGQTFSGSTVPTFGFTSDVMDGHDGCHYSSGYSGREAYHVIHGGEKGLKDIIVVLDNKTAGTNLDLMVYKTCNEGTTSHYGGQDLSFSDLVTCSQKPNGADDKVYVDWLDAGESLYVIVDTRVSSNWSNKNAAYLLHVSCDNGPGTGNPDPEPTPPHDDCFTYTQNADESIDINVSGVRSDSCNNDQIAIYRLLDPVTEEIDDSSATFLNVGTDSIVSYQFTQTDEAQYFLVCYKALCSSDASACCKQITVAPKLSCGTYYTGSTVGGTSNFDKDDVALCYSSNSSFDGPDQLLRFTKEDSSSVLELTLSHSSSNLSLFIFDENMQPAGSLCKGTNFNSSKSHGNAGTLGESYTDAADLLPAGTYYALIEGYNTNAASDFELAIACSSACGIVDTIGCGQSLLGESTATGSNSNMIYNTSDSTSVVAYTGKERTYYMEVTQSEEFTISLNVDYHSGDLDLFVVDACGSKNVLAYSIDEGDDSITMTMDSGAYYIVVDGWNGGDGSYDLSVSECADPNALSEPVAEMRSAENNDIVSAIQVMASPNPFSNSTQLRIDMPAGEKAQIRLFSATGQLLYRESATLVKGTNRISISDSEIGDYRGIVLYSIQTSQGVRQGKLLRVE